mgnify:CR=1 FL=1|tara:strand:+ start:88 stop:933 length:846 start_codon:yes stop_codon:yes gene_type:complete
MVNTFLVSSPTDEGGYAASARKLDFKRLNKQITEAIQILNLVESFAILGEMFADPIPKDPYKLHTWIRKTKKEYDALEYYLFLHQGKYAWYKKHRPAPKRLKYNESYEILEEGKILYKGKIHSKYSLVLPGDNFFSLGFWSHPSVLMFLNHPQSLKMYINAHIDVFLERGGKTSTSRKYKVDTEVEHPIWTLDSAFHLNHKAALLTKELARNESPHYIHFRDFKIAYNFYLSSPPAKNKSSSDFDYYIWPFSQDLSNPRYIIEGDKVSFKTFSDSENYIQG